MLSSKRYSVTVSDTQQNVATQTGLCILPRGLRIADAACYAGVRTWFLRQAIYEGRLSARRLGKAIIIMREDLDAFLESQPLLPASEAEWLKKRQGNAGTA